MRVACSFPLQKNFDADPAQACRFGPLPLSFKRPQTAAATCGLAIKSSRVVTAAADHPYTPRWLVHHLVGVRTPLENRWNANTSVTLRSIHLCGRNAARTALKCAGFASHVYPAIAARPKMVWGPTPGCNGKHTIAEPPRFPVMSVGHDFAATQHQRLPASVRPCGLLYKRGRERLAGAPGFEPGNVGTKNRCLTTWRRPNRARQRGRSAVNT